MKSESRRRLAILPLAPTTRRYMSMEDVNFNSI